MRIFLCVMLLLVSSPAWAEGASPLGSKHNNKSPVAIDADKLEVLQNENKAIFTGNVIATQDKMTLKGDQMVVHYRQKDKTKETAPAAGTEEAQGAVSKIDVNGHVFITSPEETAAGDNGVYDVDSKMIHLTGNVVLTKGKNVLKGSSAEYNVATGRSLLVGAGGSVDGQSGRVRGLFIPNEK